MPKPKSAPAAQPLKAGPDAATLLFFEAQPQALPLYQALHAQLCRLCPDAQLRVQKTQITYLHRHVFACVSFARVRRKAELPAPYLVLTLGLPAPLESPRVAVKTEPYPGRWTHHIVLGDARELDAELLGWVAQAYAFAAQK